MTTFEKKRWNTFFRFVKKNSATSVWVSGVDTYPSGGSLVTNEYAFWSPQYRGYQLQSSYKRDLYNKYSQWIREVDAQIKLEVPRKVKVEYLNLMVNDLQNLVIRTTRFGIEGDYHDPELAEKLFSEYTAYRLSILEKSIGILSEMLTKIESNNSRRAESSKWAGFMLSKQVFKPGDVVKLYDVLKEQKQISCSSTVFQYWFRTSPESKKSVRGKMITWKGTKNKLLFFLRRVIDSTLNPDKCKTAAQVFTLDETDPDLISVFNLCQSANNGTPNRAFIEALKPFCHGKSRQSRKVVKI